MSLECSHRTLHDFTKVCSGGFGSPLLCTDWKHGLILGSFEKYILWHFLIGVAQSKEFRIVTLYKIILMVSV